SEVLEKDDAIVGSVRVTGREGNTERVRNHLQRILRVRTLRASEVRAHHDLRCTLQSLERRLERADAEVVGDPPTFDRDAQVRPTGDAFALDVEIVERWEAYSPARSRNRHRSTSRFEYPHSLSYQLKTFTRLSFTIVSSELKIDECGLPTMSWETSGLSEY